MAGHVLGVYEYSRKNPRGKYRRKTRESCRNRGPRAGTASLPGSEMIRVRPHPCRRADTLSRCRVVDLRYLGAPPPLPRPRVGGIDARCDHRSEKELMAEVDVCWLKILSFFSQNTAFNLFTPQRVSGTLVLDFPWED